MYFEDQRKIILLMSVTELSFFIMTVNMAA